MVAEVKSSLQTSDCMFFMYAMQEEWRKGLRAMRVDSLDKLKKALPALQQEVHQLRVNTCM